MGLTHTADLAAHSTSASLSRRRTRAQIDRSCVLSFACEHVKCPWPGCLEGLEHTADLVAKQRQTFTEQTQEDLYLSTHAGKSSAKKGLGSSSAPRKGQKTVFADEEHAPSSAEPVATGALADASKPGEGQNDTAESVLQKAQWKKIARQLLKQVRITIAQMPVVLFRKLAFPMGIGESFASALLEVPENTTPWPTSVPESDVQMHMSWDGKTVKD